MAGAPFLAQDRSLLIDGKWVASDSWIDVTSPYSGDVVGRVPRVGAGETRRALDAAARVLATPIPAHERAAILERASALLTANATEAAQTIAAEAGKPLKAATVEVARAASTLTFSALEARRLAGRMVPMESHPAGEGKLAFTMRVPIGIIGAISPFNFPLNLVAHKLGPAFAAGCPVVLKPATATPLSALLLARMLHEAGLPAGWLSVVTGPSAEIGDVLVEDDRVKLITFTGSGPVGWGIAARAPKKRVALELGNSTPVIVEAGADLEAAATKLAASAFGFAGQSCISVQRIYVERPALETFLSAFLPKVEALVVGDPLDPGTDVGPVIDAGNRDRLLEWIDEARTGGATVAAGGSVVAGCIRPTVIVGGPDTLRVSCEEAFGPLAVVHPYDTFDEAIDRANGTGFGLQAGIFTPSIDRAFQAARRLEFGGVTVNETPTFRADQMPYGGIKDSGNTKEGPAWTVEAMTEERLVVVNA
ncbi:MAG: aldehyde dehydrogenase family protein [Actinobacteria bacterium]|uniref:Unannotated protein n=1 Tax=freshwater metagenome TaxID=449393 RepID=A0A6J6Q7I0_9ZZZZ|nr:aldehyde dehydrogenase family protein [Actinomycetota bacterium]